MNIICTCKDKNLIVRVDGEIDHHMAEIIRDKIDKEFIRSKAKNIIFDFNDISFMDSSGIGVIMGRYKLVKQQDGNLAIVGVNQSLERILSISGLRKIVYIYDTVEQAAMTLL